MSVCIPVVELFSDDARTRGEYEFECVPSANDRVVLSSTIGDLDIMRVAYVEHLPVELPRCMVSEDMKPTITVYVEFVNRFAGAEN